MSSDVEIIITEKCGSAGQVNTYARTGNDVTLLHEKNQFIRSARAVRNFFLEIFLPNGYPDSVSEDYLEYQIWDTLQAFCSTITGAFTTRAVMKGVGVGNANATALSAAVTWILKDGTGMIGRIIFAWWKGNGLDSDCKKWRLFADILNDAAMLTELLLPILSDYSMHVLCLTSVMKATVGVAGGATRASITHHQAIKDNMAEISAKDGSQETLVNLIASFISVFLLNMFDDKSSEWILIITLIIFHLYFNLLAVKSLVFKNFNSQRLAIVLKTFFNVGTVLNPYKVNEKESVFVGYGLKVKDICGFQILINQSVCNVLREYKVADLKQLLSVYENKPYLLLLDGRKRNIYICFEKPASTEEIIEAYFHAVCYGIATSIYNSIELDIYFKRQLHHPTPITRLNTFMKSYQKYVDNYRNIPHNHLNDFIKFVEQEYPMFFTALQINGWKTDSHSLEVGEWTTQWKSISKKSL